MLSGWTQLDGLLSAVSRILVAGSSIVGFVLMNEAQGEMKGHLCHLLSSTIF